MDGSLRRREWAEFFSFVRVSRAPGGFHRTSLGGTDLGLADHDGKDRRNCVLVAAVGSRESDPSLVSLDFSQNSYVKDK